MEYSIPELQGMELDDTRAERYYLNGALTPQRTVDKTTLSRRCNWLPKGLHGLGLRLRLVNQGYGRVMVGVGFGSGPTCNIEID